MSVVNRNVVTGRSLDIILQLHQRLAISDFAGKVVCDLGCGMSSLRQDLASLGIEATVFRVDHNPGAFTNDLESPAIVASLDCLPFESGFADLVIATYSLPYWAESKDQVEKFYAECRRIVRRGGTLSIYPIGIFTRDLFSLEANEADLLWAVKAGASAIRASKQWYDTGDPDALTVRRRR